jgi:hypothetical protein
MKKCSRCNIEYDYYSFYKDKSSKDGLRSNCKECSKKYREETRDKQKEYREKNKEKSREYFKNRIYDVDRNKKYYIDNKNKIKEKSKEYYSNNKESKLEYQKQYQQNNKEKRNKYLLERRQSDEMFRLITNIRNLINNSFYEMGYSKLSRTQEILGCSFDELKLYIERKFEPWMTWTNRGIYNGELNSGWDIDHIIPLSSAESVDDLIKLNHHSNLQPLCSKTNRDIKKNNLWQVHITH